MRASATGTNLRANPCIQTSTEALPDSVHVRRRHVLDIVPNTDELQEEVWIHEMSSQSKAHPSYEELESIFGPVDLESSALPIIVLTNRTVNVSEQ